MTNDVRPGKGWIVARWLVWSLVAALGVLSTVYLLFAAMLFDRAIRGGTEAPALIVGAIAIVAGVVPGGVFAGLTYLLGRSAPAH